MTKTAMGTNPLDAIVPTGAHKAQKTTKGRKVSVAARATPQDAPAKGKATKATFNLPLDLVNEARAAVVALSGPPMRLTLTALVEKALRVELTRLQKAHGGRPFPPIEAMLRGGRPIGT